METPHLWVDGWAHVKSLKSNKSWPNWENSIMDILDFFWTFYLNHLSPLWGYFLSSRLAARYLSTPSRSRRRRRPYPFICRCGFRRGGGGRSWGKCAGNCCSWCWLASCCGNWNRWCCLPSCCGYWSTRAWLTLNRRCFCRNCWSSWPPLKNVIRKRWILSRIIKDGLR